MTTELKDVSESSPPVEKVVTTDAMLTALLTPLHDHAVDVVDAIGNVALNARPLEPIRREWAKALAVGILNQRGIPSATALVNAAWTAATKDIPAPSEPKLIGQEVTNPEPDPWEEAVDGAELLINLQTIFERYSITPPHVSTVAALNVLRTYVMDAFDFNPLLVLTSPVLRCGKTRFLEINERLCAKPLLLSHMSPASIYRTVDEAHPTMLLDEGDTYQRMTEDYRAIINSMHSRAGAFIQRSVPTPDGWTQRKFSTYTPLVLALIGGLPATIEDRAVIVHMKRKLVTERIVKFSAKEKASLLPYKLQAIRWGLDNLEKLRLIDPVIPQGLDDRAVDIWCPFFAIAEAVGGGWLERAHAAALALSGSEQRQQEDNAEMYLLRSLRTIFKVTYQNAPRLRTAALLKELRADFEAPWQSWDREVGLTVHSLAKLLRPFGVVPKLLRFPDSDDPARGYERAPLEDAWTRYIPEVVEVGVVTDVTIDTPSRNGQGGSAGGSGVPSAPLLEGVLSVTTVTDSPSASDPTFAPQSHPPASRVEPE